MTDESKKFCFEYPSFYLISAENSHFVGNVQIDGSFYRIEFSAPKFPSTAGISCKVSKGINEVPISDFKVQMLHISDYLKQLCDFISTSTKHDNSVGFPVERTNDFLEQLRILGQDNRCKVLINNRFNVIKIIRFEGYEGHYLHLKVTNNLEVAVQSHSLPEKDSSGNDLFSVSGYLDSIVAQFWRLLEQFAEFYTHLNTIDELCTVVEPVTVTTKHNWRIFRITDKVLGKILIDPFAPSAIILNFMGPTIEVEKYRKIYNENIQRWDIDLDVYRNLLRIFDLMYFPTRKSDGEVEDKYCNICYMYMLDDHIPIISCDNPLCDLVFHVACLREWFATLKDGKTFLAVTFGSCPACKEKLSPSFVQLLEV